MATNKYNKQYFVLSDDDNKQIVFFCYTTNTKNGFCHTVQSLDNSIFGNIRWKNNLSPEREFQRSVHAYGHTSYSLPPSCVIVKKEGRPPVGM